MGIVNKWLISLLLVLNGAQHHTAIHLLCSTVVCGISDFASSEETFVYQYIPMNMSKVEFRNVKLHHLEHKVLRTLPPFVQYVVVQDSLALKSISVPKTLQIVRIMSTSLAEINFEEQSTLSRLTIKASELVTPPRTIHNARSLEFLSVTESKVRKLDLATFCGFAQLETMIWKRNKIRGIVNSASRPCALYGVLKYLRLSENKLKTLNLKLFAPFQCLVYLDIRSNKIDSIAGTHQTLVTLELTSNKLTELILCCWNLPGASSLSLQNNIVRIVPLCLQNWTHIRQFSLAGNELTNFSIESVANMDNLLELTLAWNRIEFVQLSSYKFPKNLKVFDISYNLLHQLDLSLVPVPSLTVVVVGNFITKFDVNATSPNVSIMEMGLNPIECSWQSPQERNHVQCKYGLLRKPN